MDNLNTASWKKFRLCDLFDIKTTVGIDKNKVNFISDGKYDFIGRTSVGWGVQGSVNDMSYPPNPKNTFSLVQVGETVALWREKEWYASQNLFILNPLYSEISANPLFFQSVINRAMQKYGNAYNSYPTLNLLKEEMIYLPVKEDGTPNWEYMAERIKELEAERIKELEAYLLATGLDDYELTGNDKQVLEEKPQWKEFRLCDLFIADKGDVDLQQKDINGKGCYFINSGVENFGIKGKTDKIAKVFPANSITIDFWGYACYRDFEYKLATHNHVFSLVGNVIKNREVGLFLVSRMKAFPKAFSYNNMATWNKLKEMTVSLPVKKDGSLDLDYMERYIRVTEKLAIADAVKWKDKMIETTKAIVA